MTTVFIDTNVFLSFYSLSPDDVGELKKLSDAIATQRVSLLVPQQVVDEFERNRDTKIDTSLKGLRVQKLSLQFPQICREFGEFPRIKEAQKEYERTHAELLKKLEQTAKSREFAAALLVVELFNRGTRLACGGNILASAQARMARGNPPGKNGSLGDAINWEALLEHGGRLSALGGQSLHLVTADRDYLSALDQERPNAFLDSEWSRVAKGNLTAYPRLSKFLQAVLPNIRLGDEEEKEQIVARLASSSSFQSTHAVVAELSRYSHFSEQHAAQILKTVLENDQVRWIATDDDVATFIKRVLAQHWLPADGVLSKLVDDTKSLLPQTETS